MAEALSNLRMYCRKHSDELPKPTLTAAPLASFVGKFVKKAFDVSDEHGRRQREHMWVKVDGVDGGALVGVLDNDPFYRSEVKAGDRVVVRREEIEDVL